MFPQLYEQILAENEKLKAQLRDTDLELADLKLQLEKATQVLLLPRRLSEPSVFTAAPSDGPVFSLCRGRNATLTDRNSRWREG